LARTTAATGTIRAPVVALRARPRAMAIAGALTIAFSAILVKQSGATPSTAAIFRCAYAIPLLLGGVVLISGALEKGAYGDNPAQGVVYGLATGLAYTGFILLLRAGSGDRGRVAGPLFDATLVGALGAVAIGLVVGDADLVPSWPAHAWLATLALTSQVIGWLLIAASLPRLPAALTSLLLTIQPVGSVILGAILFAEAPSNLQLVGVAAILGGLVMVARVRPPASEGI
jgi:drug/metabolite transporter (DMT)-like permease